MNRIRVVNGRRRWWGRGVLALCGLVSTVVLLTVSAPAAAPTRVDAPVLTFEQKMAWMLLLEDRRVLSLPTPFPPVPPPAPVPLVKKKAAPVPPPPTPDLVRLLGDHEARIRRRAALAVGRVGLPAGVAPLVPLLASDPEEEVRQMAAFALGLIAHRSAVGPLRAALSDPSPLVQGRAAEALATIGDTASAELIARLVTAHASNPALAVLAPGDEAYPQPAAVEAYRLGLYALVRLKAWQPLAAVVLAADGLPTVRWWPVAYALSRLEDPRAVPALIALARTTEAGIGRAFAARGLGARAAVDAVPVLVELVQHATEDPRTAVQAVRSLGQIGGHDAIVALRAVARTKATEPNLRLEAVSALIAAHDKASLPLMHDLLTDAWPAMRMAALRGAAAFDADNFFALLSGLEPDPNPLVRRAMADILGGFDAERAAPRLLALATEPDARVVAAAIAALTTLNAPGLAQRLPAWLTHPDVMVRAAAAAAVAAIKPDGGAAQLIQLYRSATRDAEYNARTAALDALEVYGPAVAGPVWRDALGDTNWAVRVHAATLLRKADPQADVSVMRPGPARPDSEYLAPELVNPTVSPHVYFETDKGTVEVELFVLDAPQACANLLRLARRGFFTGLAIHRVVPNFVVQDGDPRGDGEGGPGYTIRDEINQQPYQRGTMGMALEWADTGGSQWFITHAPQPHLDGRYTAFGRVVSGSDVLDRLQQFDVIRRVRTWDGVTMSVK